jgi:hypothetical protein
MAVNVCLPLFGHAGRELEEGTTLKGARLRAFAEELRERLQHAADLLDRLAAAGWTAQLAMYDVLVAHPEVQTREEAERRLRALGLAPEEFMIVEEMEEEEPADGA